MKIDIKTVVVDGKKKTVGYELIAENDTDREAMAVVRDIEFFAFGDDCLEYDGLKTLDGMDKDTKPYKTIKSLSWARKWHKDAERIRRSEEIEKKYRGIAIKF